MVVKFKKYGWTRDIPDQRDLKFVAPMSATELPTKVDLRNMMPAPYDQGVLGSCTAQSLAGLLEFSEHKQNKPTPQTPSRLFIYYNERLLESTINVDAGATLRSGIKSLVKFGYCEEVYWPYVIQQFKKKPPRLAYRDAARSRISQYARIDNQNIHDMKSALANGNPFVFGFAVYESFDGPETSVAKTGIMTIPQPNEKMLGGHAVLAVGYDDERQIIIVRNSWGVNWGDKGYFYMPYSYITNPAFAADFWTITMVP